MESINAAFNLLNINAQPVTTSKESSSTSTEPPELLSKREQFYATYNRQQAFALPSSIIYYIAKNPSTSKIYQRLIQCCKYFFTKNSMLLLHMYHNVTFDKSPNGFMSKKKNINLNTIPSKSLYIVDGLRIWPSSNLLNNLLSTIVAKTVRFDVSNLDLYGQEITFDEFKLISTNVKQCYFKCLTVTDGNGNEVSLDVLLANLPKIKNFIYSFRQDARKVTSNTLQNIIQILPSSHLTEFYLFNAPESLKIEPIFEYLKTNQKIAVRLEYRETISFTFKNRLQSVIQEIIDESNHSYKPPFITYPNIHHKTRGRLSSLFYPS